MWHKLLIQMGRYHLLVCCFFFFIVEVLFFVFVLFPSTRTGLSWEDLQPQLLASFSFALTRFLPILVLTQASGTHSCAASAFIWTHGSP